MQSSPIHIVWLCGDADAFHGAEKILTHILGTPRRFQTRAGMPFSRFLLPVGVLDLHVATHETGVESYLRYLLDEEAGSVNWAVMSGSCKGNPGRVDINDVIVASQTYNVNVPADVVECTRLLPQSQLVLNVDFCSLGVTPDYTKSFSFEKGIWLCLTHISESADPTDVTGKPSAFGCPLYQIFAKWGAAHLWVPASEHILAEGLCEFNEKTFRYYLTDKGQTYINDYNKKIKGQIKFSNVSIGTIVETPSYEPADGKWQHGSEILGADVNSHQFYMTARKYPNCKYLIVKGVCDSLATQHATHHYANESSAAWLILYLRQLYP